MKLVPMVGEIMVGDRREDRSTVHINTHKNFFKWGNKQIRLAVMLHLSGYETK